MLSRNLLSKQRKLSSVTTIVDNKENQMMASRSQKVMLSRPVMNEKKVYDPLKLKKDKLALMG